MAGRFAHALPPEHQDALAATNLGAPNSLTAQLVFPPRRHRNENVTRTLRLLPHVIELSGHQETDATTIRSPTSPSPSTRAASTSYNSPPADASTSGSCTPWKAARRPRRSPDSSPK